LVLRPPTAVVSKGMKRTSRSRKGTRRRSLKWLHFPFQFEKKSDRKVLPRERRRRGRRKVEEKEEAQGEKEENFFPKQCLTLFFHLSLHFMIPTNLEATKFYFGPDDFLSFTFFYPSNKSQICRRF
jgi:hypothetical protein